MSEIASRVKTIIVDKLGVDESEVTPTANFTSDLGADSLDTVELIMEFEKEFGITIPDLLFEHRIILHLGLKRSIRLLLDFGPFLGIKV